MTFDELVWDDEEVNGMQHSQLMYKPGVKKAFIAWKVEFNPGDALRYDVWVYPYNDDGTLTEGKPYSSSTEDLFEFSCQLAEFNPER